MHTISVQTAFKRCELFHPFTPFHEHNTSLLYILAKSEQFAAELTLNTARDVDADGEGGFEE